MIGFTRCPDIAPPWCFPCGTDEYIIVESASECRCKPGTAVSLSYSCLECGTFGAHCTIRDELGESRAAEVSAMMC